MQPPKMMIASGALLAAWLTAASAAPAQTIWYVNDDGNPDTMGANPGPTPVLNCKPR